LTPSSEQIDKTLFIIVPARDRFTGAAITFNALTRRSSLVQWNMMTTTILRKMLQLFLKETAFSWHRLR
jgi:hypothetical protein